MSEGHIEVVPATADRFDDVAAMLDPGRGEDIGCWCLAWRPPRPDRNRRRRMLDLTGAEPAPGMLAYRDGQVVGWLGFSPKSLVPRLQNSRKLPVGDPESWPTTWSVMCFLVRVGFRRQGVARALLDGAVTYATDHGARRIEGYPVDGGGRRVPVSAAFVGTVDLFEAAGFQLIEPTAATSGRLPRMLMVRQQEPVGADPQPEL